MIESAWKSAGGKTKAREKLAQGKLSEDGADELQECLEEVIPSLREGLDRLSAEDLLAFDRILERKLFEIDRVEVQEHTDGSDDGFLYARGFIVVAGRTYFDAVNAEPSKAMMGLECEDMCFLPYHLYSEKFGEMPASEISRESHSNKAGWPDLQSNLVAGSEISQPVHILRDLVDEIRRAEEKATPDATLQPDPDRSGPG
jgi:Protein of unknown function (DUF4240)